ncbi:hypothetical protein G9A89_015385 [Geosiphon pyriformis]|nr:hypothetical protein G9A89_015385 [Geosiphon pyriformis]
MVDLMPLVFVLQLFSSTVVVSLDVNLDINMAMGKLSVTILDLYAGASVEIRFGLAMEVNFLIAKAVNSSSFVVLGGDFNEDESKKSASFRKCLNLGLVNSLSKSSVIRSSI